MTIWNSGYSVEGNFLEVSSNYAILFQNKIACKTDFERENRFYKKDESSLKQHAFQFHIWKYSVFSKFTIEALMLLLFIMVMLQIKWELALEQSHFMTLFD